jgi:hypothetical protein
LKQVELHGPRLQAGRLHLLYGSAGGRKPDHLISMPLETRFQGLERGRLTNAGYALQPREAIAAAENFRYCPRLRFVQIGIALLGIRSASGFKLTPGILRGDDLPKNFTLLIDCLRRRVSLSRRVRADVVNLNQ